MSIRLVVLFDNFGPYHLARLKAARERGINEGITVIGLEAFDSSKEYQWLIKKEKNHVFTIFSADKPPIGPRFFFNIWQILDQLRPDALALPGYGYLDSLTALTWAKWHGKMTVIMSDSTYQKKERNRWKEGLKRQIVKRFDAALVAGSLAKGYINFLGIPKERIFIGYDVVDNEYFARGADEARRKAEFYRSHYVLPKKYFLTVSRFIDGKNLHILIEAYHQYQIIVGKEAWDLVLCGSGPLEAHLRSQAEDLLGVHFPGFKQADELPFYYGLARCLIMPSLGDTWGLVINEAMASGLPVLVSKACGCAPDLIHEGLNGFTFDPYKLDDLIRLMVKMTLNEVNLPAMGTASCKIIAAWTPETFADNLIQAIKSCRS